MKILVMSDSHGAKPAVKNAVLREKPDMVLFLGDGYGDAEAVSEEFSNIPFEMVQGNCDSGMKPTEKVIEVSGKKILMCHGHEYKVERDLISLSFAAKEKGADIALYGHTHKAFYDFDGRLHIMNPGSIGKAHYPDKEGYGLVFIENGEIFIRLMEA